MGLSNQDATQVYTSNGIRTQYGVIIPPGARVAAYVRSTGVQSGDDSFLSANLVSTLAAGLARARAGLGDFVVVLPGHTENVTDATTFSGALLAGTKIIGVGKGSNMPTFNFLVAAGSWVVNKADVSIIGLKFNFNSATPSTAPIALSGADFSFLYNECIVSGAAGGIANLITVSAGADRFDVSGNYMRGAASTPTTLINIGAATADSRITYNEVVCGAPSATGHFYVGTACLGMRILNNNIMNTTAASVAAIAYVNAATTGICAYNNICVLSTGAVSAGVTGITVGGVTNLTGYFQNFVVNDPNKSGFLAPAVDT